MSKKLVVDVEVQNLIENALNKCSEKLGLPRIFPRCDMEDDKYGYIYRAISDPVRLAAIERKKVDEGFDFTFCHLGNGWLKENGVLLKTGKALRLIFPNIGNDKIEILAGYVADELRETVATGDIVQVSDTPSEVYTIPSRRAEDVGNSCMRGKRAERFQLYDDIDCCRIAYVKDGEWLIGRALLWDEVFIRDTEETIKIMDRCFFKDRVILSNLLAWAKNNGYWVKKYPDRANCSVYISPSGEEKDFVSLSVKTGFMLENEMYNEVPYLDTFCYCYGGGDRLHSYDQGDVCLQDTGGRGDFLTGDYTNECHECGCRLSEDSQIYSDITEEFYCEECYNEVFTHCENCEEDFSRENSIDVMWEDGYPRVWCEECAKEDRDVVRCDWCGAYHHKNSPTINKIVGTKGKYICGECLSYSNIYERCAECNDVYHVSDLNEDDLCSDCAERNEKEKVA